MKQILTIGHTTIALPMSVNLNAIIQVLSKGDSVDEHYTTKDGETFLIKGSLRLEMKVVEDGRLIDPKKRKAIPEKTGGPYLGERMTAED